ncbi:MAG: helix-turn-helix transcriptional regulator [Coriobacteriaceae bacterium]|nr:helix-turn-helix transcriptional regulator [Coriobacteriaceae bacterium]
MVQPSLMGRRMNIVNERTRRGMSQEDLAVAVHAHLNSVSRWESGQVAPDGMHLLAMSELFGVDPAYLMQRVGDKDA